MVSTALKAAIVLSLFIVSAQAAPKPTATPDLSKVSEREILDTIKHKEELQQQQTVNIQNIIDVVNKQQETLGQATQAVLKLQQQISEQAAENTKLKVSNAKKDGAIWRDIIIFTGVGLIIGLVGPKLLPLIAGI